MKVIFSDEEKRMDRFDAVIHEYLRANRKSIEYLAEKAGCNPSSLWRYRRKVEYFRRAPLSVVANCLRMANVSNQIRSANSIDRNLLRFVTVEGSSLPSELWYQHRIFFWKLSQMRG